MENKDLKLYLEILYAIRYDKRIAAKRQKNEGGCGKAAKEKTNIAVLSGKDFNLLFYSGPGSDFDYGELLQLYATRRNRREN